MLNWFAWGWLGITASTVTLLPCRDSKTMPEQTGTAYGLTQTLQHRGISGRGNGKAWEEARLKAHKPQYAPDACLIVYR